MTTGKLGHSRFSIRDFSHHRSGILESPMNLDCLGSDNAERSYQRRFIALPIVPDYLRERRKPSRSLRQSFYLSICSNGLTPFLNCERFRALRRFFKEQLVSSKFACISHANDGGQLNTLQTVVPVSPYTHRERKEYGQASRLISTS